MITASDVPSHTHTHHFLLGFLLLFMQCIKCKSVVQGCVSAVAHHGAVRLLCVSRGLRWGQQPHLHGVWALPNLHPHGVPPSRDPPHTLLSGNWSLQFTFMLIQQLLWDPFRLPDRNIKRTKPGGGEGAGVAYRHQEEHSVIVFLGPV